MYAMTTTHTKKPSTICKQYAIEFELGNVNRMVNANSETMRKSYQMDERKKKRARIDFQLKTM